MFILCTFAQGVLSLFLFVLVEQLEAGLNGARNLHVDVTANRARVAGYFQLSNHSYDFISISHQLASAS